jgi:predicted nucleic-acid-binding Zn-ribbon protein
MSEPCPKCGSKQREDGGLGRWLPILFWRGRFARGRPLRAIACLDCGHVELLLKNVLPKEAPVERKGTIDDVFRKVN